MLDAPSCAAVGRRAASGSPRDLPVGLWRVRDRRTFVTLRAVRSRGRSGPVTITVVPSVDGTPPRLAFAIGKRVGTAVERNRLRRRLRAVVAELQPPSGAYLLSAGPGATVLSYAELRTHVSRALDAVVARS